jgi:hypothetical protein
VSGTSIGRFGETSLTGRFLCPALLLDPLQISVQQVKRGVFLSAAGFFD